MRGVEFSAAIYRGLSRLSGPGSGISGGEKVLPPFASGDLHGGSHLSDRGSFAVLSEGLGGFSG